MGKYGPAGIFSTDDPVQDAQNIEAESDEWGGEWDDRWDAEDECDEEEETLSLCESFHYLLYSDPEDQDAEWEEINRKVMAGARPSDD